VQAGTNSYLQVQMRNVIVGSSTPQSGSQVRMIVRGIPWTLARYLTVGLLNTCVGLGIIYLGLYLLGLGDVAANVTGYAVGIVLSFVLNKHWTFVNKGQSTPQFLRFLLVTAVAYAVNLTSVVVLIKVFGTNNYIAQALGIGPYTMIGYFGSRLFVFRGNAS
jgi:putative flippase GtrA